MENNCGQGQEIIEMQRNFARMQSQYWMDASFREQLTRDPKKTMTQNGLCLPDKTNVELHVNTESVVYFVVPPKPNIGTIGLEGIAAAGTFGCAGSFACAGSICGSIGSFGTMGTFGCGGA